MRPPEALSPAAAAMHGEQRRRGHREVDRLFLFLMGAQWAAAIAGAVLVAPRAWAGSASSVHAHVWGAAVLGGLFALPAMALAYWRSGDRLTRSVIAASQVLFSGLLIHLTGGRIETHFHIFGSLAFLALYKDWRLLLLATGIIMADHALRGWLWPRSVYGADVVSPALRTLEHTAWVAFEVVVLSYACVQWNRLERADAAARAALAEAGERTACEVARRSRQLMDAQQAVRAERTLLSHIVGAIPFYVFWKDRQSRFLGCNRAFAESMGFSSPAELVGKSDMDLSCTPDEAEGYRRDDEEVMSRGRPRLNIEETQHRPDGSVKHLLTSKVPLFDERGVVYGLLGIYMDMTERKRLESRLLEAQRLAEEASRAKSEFLANMSHEIRTPMTAILGFAELLDEDGDVSRAPARRLETIRTIKRNGEHLLGVINDILDLSKIESGRMQVESLPTDVARVVGDVVALMAPRAAAKGLELRCEYGSAVPRTITSDPLRLRQILLNLVGNALKFTERGHVGVAVETVRGSGGDAIVRIEVRDTGIGMSHDLLGRLFRPFTQADETTTRRFGGTGLGLAISQRLAAMLGGRIMVESAPGAGSVFTLELPAGPVSEAGMWWPQPSREEAQGSDTGDEPGGAPLAGVRVLLAEDGPDNQRLITFHLRRAGAAVEVVGTGQAAVERLTVGRDTASAARDPAPFDVVLMDMQMPEMDGYTATRLLRSLGARVPIVALTAHAMTGDRERCLASGCDAYATKPIDRAELIRLCADLARRRTPARA